jgi:hypothetical protein
MGKLGNVYCVPLRIMRTEFEIKAKAFLICEVTKEKRRLAKTVKLTVK